MSFKSMDEVVAIWRDPPSPEYVADYRAMFRTDVLAGLYGVFVTSFAEMVRRGWIANDELRELAEFVLLRYAHTSRHADHRIDAAHALASLGAEGRPALVEALAIQEKWRMDPELEVVLRILLKRMGEEVPQVGNGPQEGGR